MRVYEGVFVTDTLARWGLTPREWDECAKAARELLDGVPSVGVEEIAIQLALAKAIEAFAERELQLARGVPIQ